MFEGLSNFFFLLFERKIVQVLYVYIESSSGGDPDANY